MSRETYRFLLRMPEELRDRLKESASRSNRSLNSEIVDRLGQSLDADERSTLAQGLMARTATIRGDTMVSLRQRRTLVALGAVLVLALTAVLVGRLSSDGSAPVAVRGGGDGETTPALARKFAQLKQFAPPTTMAQLNEGKGADATDDWQQLATPGNEVTQSMFTGARTAWDGHKSRGAKGGGAWTPLGPTIGSAPFNPFRDRSVYNAGTKNFSGRIGHAAIDPHCNAQRCRLWIANANGGVWGTDNALAAKPDWTYLSQTFEHNNTSSIEIDPNDPTADTLWVGTGELNACGSGCEAGVGLYKTTNGGKSWKGPYGIEQFQSRAVSSIAVKPGDSNTIFAASGRAVRGVSNVCCGGADALIPGAPHFGLWRSTDGGTTWEIVSQGATALCTNVNPDDYSLGALPCSPRGARRVMFDPVDPNTVYASFFARGIWRSNDTGTTWQQIMTPLGGGNNERAEFDVVALPNGNTRMYVGVGGGAGQPARFRRNDDVRNVAAATVQTGWLTLTSSTVNSPGYSSFGYCDPQCSYDNYVYVPPGADADTVYLSGDNEYNENDFVTGRSNGRAVLLSTDAGATFTDLTEDDRDDTYPGALHPDHHAIVTNPQNWKQFFDVGDGGISRSNGVFVDDSGDCGSAPKNYTGANRTFCELVLSRVPERLDAINEGLRTLHFYEINYNPNNPDEIAGGTQDNGSWETNGDHDTWVNTNVADGGHNNFDIGDPNFRMTAWQSGQIQVNFNKLNQTGQTWISDNLFNSYGNEAVAFTATATNDPRQSGWLWTGREHVFRSTNFGLNPTFTKAEVLASCNVWNGDFDLDNNGVFNPTVDICDDWRALGNPGAAGRLTGATYGATLQGGHVAVVERTKADTSTLWAGTSTGRILVSKNADAANPATVTFTRLDTLAANAPPRYPSAIFVDREDANHAWISYSGFNAKTPATPGHVFEVRYDPTAGTATFTSLDGSGPKGFGDIPATALAVSDKGTVWVGTDFGVLRRKDNQEGWHLPAAGLPNLAIGDIVFVPERDEIYVGTHGQGVWSTKAK